MRGLRVRLLLALTFAAAWRGCASAPIVWNPPENANFSLPSGSSSTTGPSLQLAKWITAGTGSAAATSTRAWLAGLMRIIGGSPVAQGSAGIAITAYNSSSALPSYSHVPFRLIQRSKRSPAAARTLQGGSLTAQPHFRIVGGQPAIPRGRYRYIASMRDGKGRHYCAGTLITDRVVMSAAHCLDQTDDALRRPTVIIGKFYNKQDEDNVVKTRCTASYVHEGWSFVRGQNDISLCILEEPVKGIAPIQLEHNVWSNANAPLTVLGWGANQEGGSNSEQLQSTQVYLMDYRSCNTTYSGRIGQPMQICAGLALGGSDACQGDSGGPLVMTGANASEDVQVGIVSWGSGCGEAGKPGVYTQVAYYVPWINAKLKSVLGITLPDPGMAEDQKQACACSQNGRSGNITVKEQGCKQHDLKAGSNDYYCYVQGGSNCTLATASQLYGKAAAWRACTPTADDLSGSMGNNSVGEGGGGHTSGNGVSNDTSNNSTDNGSTQGPSNSKPQYPLIMGAVASEGKVVDSTAGALTASPEPKVEAAEGPASQTTVLGQMLGMLLGGR